MWYFSWILGVLLAAAYMLRLVQGVIWGAPPTEASWRDLTRREWLILLPLAVMVLWLGLYPATFLEPLHDPVRLLLEEMPLLAAEGGMP